jgi:hypothetical protein
MAKMKRSIHDWIEGDVGVNRSGNILLVAHDESSTVPKICYLLWGLNERSQLQAALTGTRVNNCEVFKTEKSIYNYLNAEVTFLFNIGSLLLENYDQIIPKKR